MRRSNPFQSVFGFIATLGLLAGLGVMLWLRGGEAFSPGKLTSISHSGLQSGGFFSHAEFEPDCSNCHQPLETTQGQLCLACHVEVAGQIETGSGTHSHIENASRCAECHSDHRGRDFDPTRQAFTSFNHTLTHFSLVWHQVNYDATPMDCAACHSLEPNFSVSIEECTTCHSKRDDAFVQQHIRDFGKGCLECHDGTDRMTRFDHQATEFKLEGQHAVARCGACHSIEKQASRSTPRQGQARFALLAGSDKGVPDPLHQFQDTPVGCVECHAEPEMHLGLFPQECSSCHTAHSWSPARLVVVDFEHQAITGFSLHRHVTDASNQPIRCNTCHLDDIQTFDVQTCITCHSSGDDAASAFMQQHTTEVGLFCTQCHDGVDRMEYFSHDNLFPLGGRHAEVACSACHSNYIYKDTPAACVQCHVEPAIHAGSFGLQCQYCHTDQGWQPAQLRKHRFPLDHGGQGVVACQTCHVQRYDEITCYGCHEHQVEPIQTSHLAGGIAFEDLPLCAECHPDGLQGEQTKIDRGE